MRWMESRIPPVAVAFAAAVAMRLAANAAPGWRIALPGRGAVVLATALTGVLILIAAAYEFSRAHTTLDPLHPRAASALVVSGVFRYSRNPMYLGMAILLVAWGLYLSHPLALLGVPAFVAYINRFQIIPEEKALRALFPGAFEAYARQVRRWI